MLEIQLYIKNQRLDLFKDESVTLTDSIQNIRDIDKVFTSFSRSFNLPASKTNSKIFKHFYNFHLDAAYSFDARVKQPANIELNSLPFRRGYIQLTGVDLKENIPNSYKVTFFGEIVKLKDAIGEQKLSDLQGLGSFIYNSNNVYYKLVQSNTVNNDTCVPLITHTQRLFYDSNSSVHNTGNLAPGGNKHGVKWNELKPAMRVNRIIEAIEQTYPQLQFSTDFFKNTSVEKMHNLFLWVCRKSGAVENLSGALTVTTPIDFGIATSPQGVFDSYETVQQLVPPYDPAGVVRWRYIFSTQSNQPYTIILQRFGQTVYTRSNVTGNQTVRANFFFQSGDFTVENGFYTISIQTDAPIAFTNIKWEVQFFQPSFISDQLTRNTGAFTTASDFVFDYAKQLPDITVIDFLSGLFRLFNLTAFVDNLGVIKVLPLNEYYNDSPATYDVTEYTSIEKSSVNSALPYRQVKFLFKDTKSFLANKFGEIFNQAWGLLQYNGNKNDLSGSLYKVEPPFGHFLFERLTDAGTNTQVDLQIGWSVDKSQNAMLPSPLLFYPVDVPDVPPIEFVDEVDDNNEPVSTISANPRNMPFNSVSYDATINNFQLNFQLENSEWTGDTSFTVTLFSAYKSYIESIFNPKQRLTNIEVQLPVALLLKIQMKDKIIIAGNNYLINKLTTNLQTGKSELELINEFGYKN